MAPVLAATHRVYLVQVNGFGGDAPGDKTTPELLDGITADLDGYLRSHAIERPAIIGHSMGGLVAMMMGVRYPQATALWKQGFTGSIARRVPIADSWHFVLLDQSAAFAPAVKDFLAAK